MQQHLIRRSSLISWEMRIRACRRESITWSKSYRCRTQRATFGCFRSSWGRRRTGTFNWVKITGLSNCEWKLRKWTSAEPKTNFISKSSLDFVDSATKRWIRNLKSLGSTTTPSSKITLWCEQTTRNRVRKPTRICVYNWSETMSKGSKSCCSERKLSLKLWLTMRSCANWISSLQSRKLLQMSAAMKFQRSRFKCLISSCSMSKTWQTCRKSWPVTSNRNAKKSTNSTNRPLPNSARISREKLRCRSWTLRI